MRDRMSRCTCDQAPGQYQGPDEDCPAHGDPLLFADEVVRLRAELETWQGRYRSSVETYRDVAAEAARLRSELAAAQAMLRKAGNRG